MRTKLFFIAVLLFLIFPRKTDAQTWQLVTGSICPHCYIESWPVAVDSSGNIYEAGFIDSYLPDTAARAFFGGDTIHKNINLIISTDSNGNYRWALPIRSARGDEISKMVLGPTGDLYLFGCFAGWYGIGSDSMYSPSGGYSAFCIRLDTSGHVKWMKKMGDLILSGPYTSGDVDNSGNAYIAGGFNAPSCTIGTTVIVNHSGLTDGYVAKLDTSGNVLWARDIGGDSIDYITDLAVTSWGDAIIVGQYKSVTLSLGSSTLTSSCGGANNNFFVVRLNGAGSVVWANNVANNSSFSTINAVATDMDGNSYITGGYSGHASIGPFALPVPGTFNMFLAQYSNSGTPMWARTIDGSPEGWSIAPDICGKIWFSASTGDDVDNATIGYYHDNGTFGDSVHIRAAGDDKSSICVDNRGALYLGADFFNPLVHFGSDSVALLDSTLETLLVAKMRYPMCLIMKDTALLHQGQVTLTEPRLYPNPASNEITISASGDIATISIINITGSVMHTYAVEPASSATIDVSQLPSGVYLCHIYQQNGILVTKKIVILK